MHDSDSIEVFPNTESSLARPATHPGATGSPPQAWTLPTSDSAPSAHRFRARAGGSSRRA
eukprot:6193301-Pleurochrysis_carterae.AAC.2